LKGARRDADRGLDTLFEEAESESLIDMMAVDMVIGTGGLLSHAPRRAQSFLMMTDGFEPEGYTRLYVDSIFMMPHLGVLSTVLPDAALEIFDKDCLVRLGSLIAPKNTSRKTDKTTKGEMRYEAELPDGKTENGRVTFGHIKRIPLKEKEKATVEIQLSNNLDVGAGAGRPKTFNVEGGAVGVVLDLRGRPIYLPEDRQERLSKLMEWYTEMEAYDIPKIEKLKEELK
jgi:hypothetical protein